MTVTAAAKGGVSPFATRRPCPLHFLANTNSWSLFLVRPVILAQQHHRNTLVHGIQNSNTAHNALKAFHEASAICFIVVGVWLEENRLVVFNGDLTGRLVAIDADRWSDTELTRVIQEGCKLLNVDFDTEFSNQLVKESYGSVYIVQEACRQACIRAGIRHTQQFRTTVGEGLDTRGIVKEVVDQQGGRYRSFLSQFAAGFQETRLEMYKWLLYPILAATPDKLEEGFKWADLRRALNEHHPQGDSLNPGNLTQALQSTASLQVAKDIKPIILDYDQTNTVLTVVDRGFVIWLQNQDKLALFESLELPAPVNPNQMSLEIESNGDSTPTSSS